MGLTRLTAIELVNSYPDNIKIDAYQDDFTDKWLAIVYRLKEGEIHKMLVSMTSTETNPGYDTKDEAIKTMEDIILELAIQLEI